MVTTPGKRGNIATTEPVTNAQIEAIHDAIDKGQFQIEQRTITGALGVREFSDAGGLEKTIHQATGRPLAEFLETKEGQDWAKRTHYRETSPPAESTPTATETHQQKLTELGRALGFSEDDPLGIR